jgi:SAM-dependent methyltransferase
MTAPEEPSQDYRSLNLANWEERAAAHAASPDYAVERFVAEPDFLSRVVRFDLPRLGSVRGLRGVHLQCHIGTDTLSLSRLGARMSGLDFSAASLEQARRLAAATGTDIDYIQGDVYDAVDLLGAGQFDLVFTGIGALCWLPNIQRWAEVVDRLLRPGGRVFLREGHPMLWALADAREDGLLVVEESYFETVEPTLWEDAGTYVQTDVEFTANRTASWNHALGEVITALMDHGLTITGFEEHQSVPWEAIPGQMVKLADHEWQLADRPNRLAHSYTLQAVKRHL